MSEENKNEKLCTYCNREIAIRNPTGRCDHLYYPENVNKDFNKKDDGGPAFPTDCTTEDGNLGACFSRGQTLRDYFAGQSLMGLRAAACAWSSKEVSVRAYADADAMLEARKK